LNPFHLVLPAAGFLVCFYVLAHPSHTAKMIGGGRCAAGLVHAFVLTGGFPRERAALPETASLD
jgi:hypothetical protein